MSKKDLLYKYLEKSEADGIINRTISPKEKNEILRKYNNILRILSTYIPQNIVYNKIVKKEKEHAKANFVKGTLLFADINGFTAMTETLSKHGNEGAEEITKILNNFFETMIKVIFKFKGILVKYGGDAMMIFFSSEDVFCKNEHPYHAISCAHEIKEKMKFFSKVESRFGEFNLYVSISLRSDTYFEAVLGNPDIHCEYFLTGPAVEKTALMETEAGKNEIVVDIKTLENINVDSRVKSHKSKGKYINIEEINKLELPEVESSLVGIDFDDIDSLLYNIEILKSYIIDGVYEKIEASWQRLILEGENRPVSIIFLNYFFTEDIFTDNKNAEEIYSILNQYFNMVQKTVKKYDGIINKIDMYTNGDKIVIIFGFPRMHYDDDERAIRCAKEIFENSGAFENIEIKGKKVSIKQKAGVNSGFIYCGNAGSSLRKEYTIMGDSVNLAARIMGIAQDNEIWISDDIYKKIQKITLIEQSENKKFKGKKEKIAIHKVSGVTDEVKVKNEVFIGRKTELENILNHFEKANKSFSSLQIIGSVGVGKTYLMKEFIKNIDIQHEILIGRGLPYGKEIQYNAFKEILVSFFGITRKDSGKEIKSKIKEYVDYLNLSNLNYTIPLLGVLLSTVYKDEPVLSIDNPIEKKELLFNTFSRLIEARCKINPILFVIEDAEWLDKNSLELINDLVDKNIKGLFVLVLTRNELYLSNKAYKLYLNPFNKDETKNFVNEYLEKEQITENLINEIYTKSNGIPYFIFEIINSIKEHGVNKDLPESIYKSVLSRMDLLSEKVRNTLKTASVIGVEFSINLLDTLLDNEGNLEAYLDKLEKQDFIISNKSSEYTFRNVMVKEVAYNSISSNKRSELHKKIGFYMEKLPDKAQHFELIAFHYDKGGIPEKSLYYYSKSGDKATELNNYNKALEYYKNALVLIDKSKKDEEIFKLQVEILKKCGKISLILNDIDNANEFYNKAYLIAEENSFNKDIADCLLNNGIIYLNLGQAKEATESFNKAEKLYSELKDHDGLATCYLNIGLILKIAGKSKYALKEYEKALENYKKANNSLGSADAYNNLGNLAKELSNFDDALEHYNNSLDIYKNINHEIGLASVYNNIGTLYNSMGDAEKALTNFERSLSIEENIGNEKGKAVCYNNIGNAYVHIGKWEEADKNFAKGLEISYKIKDNKEIANISLNHGVMYMYKEDYYSAEQYLKNSYDIYKTINDNYGMYTALYNLGMINLKSEQIEVAEDFFNQAFDAAKNHDDNLLLEAIINISRNYYFYDKYGKADKLVEKGFEIINDNSLIQNKITFYQLAAKIKKSLGEIQTAIEIMNKVLEFKVSVGDESGLAFSKIHLALLYSENENNQKAKELLEEAEKYFKGNENIIGELFCTNKIGLINYKNNKYDKALKYLNSSIDKFNSLNLMTEATSILKKISIIHFKMSDYEKAFQTINEVIKSEKDELDDVSADSYKILANIYLKQKEYDKAIEALEECYEKEIHKEGNEKFKVALMLGKIFKKLEKLGSAIIYFEKCAGSPDRQFSLKAMKELAILYERAGQKERLRNVLRRIIMFETNMQTKFEIGNVINMF